jgi:large repetitive protein
VASVDLDCTDSGEHAVSNDCDDTNAAIHPGATEVVADGIDQDCTGGDACYQDLDRDGYGATTVIASTDLDCDDTGESSLATDCDDSDSSKHPGAAEVCNEADDDCDGAVDEGLATRRFYRDADGDGYGHATIYVDRCMAPSGYVENKDDCDDTNASINPGATEICNLKDDNCDGVVDEGWTKFNWYRDADGDGWGDSSTKVDGCVAPSSGYVAKQGDCDDTNALVNPDQPEILCNGIDDDCDGVSSCL